MKLFLRLLAVLVLSCCAFFVLSNPPQTVGALDACTFCETNYQGCMSRCASGDTACQTQCTNTYNNYCATPDCPPKKLPYGRPPRD